MIPKIPMTPIRCYVKKVLNWDPQKSSSDTLFDYIDISSVSRDTKQVEETTQMLAHSAPSRARQIVKARDILVSTVQPNLNAVAQVPQELDGATASTRFTVLRPNEEILHSRYLYYWVRSPAFIGEMTVRATGVSYPAVTDNIVKDSKLPLPPLPEQRRIAAILDKADAIRRKRAKALELVDEFLKSSFFDLVGPNAPNYKRWPVKTIAELASPSGGAMRTGPFGSSLRHSEFVDEGIAVLGIDNAVNNRFAWAQRRFITEEKFEELERYTVLPGDVIITIMGTTGRTAVVPEGIPTAISTKHLATITLDRKLAHPQFIAFSIRENPEILHQIAIANTRAVMDGLNLTMIKEIRLRVPPLNVQKQFESLVNRTEKTRNRLVSLEDDSGNLINSLAQRAFRGEL